MPTVYPGSVVGTIATKMGTIRDFYNDFGCACDGVTDDTAAANAALASVSGSGNAAYIYLPSGLNMCVNYLELPAGAQITLFGQGRGSTITFIGTPPGRGRVIIPAGSQGVKISGLAFEGRVEPPALIDYASYPSPTQANLVTGSTFWIQGGSLGGIQTNDIEISDCWSNHPEGYLALLDATGGAPTISNSLSNILIERLRSRNSRNNWFGAAGVYNCGGFGGGILVASDGQYSNCEDLTIRHCRFDRHSGNVIWMWAPATTLLNRNISVIKNYIRVCALDGIQFACVDGGLEEGNVIEGFGYASTSDSDVFGYPRYLNAGGYKVVPVGYDTAGRALRLVRRGNRAWGNGNGYDLDCMGDGIVDGNHLTWAATSGSQYAQASLCGPANNGVNDGVGINTGNTNNDEGGSLLSITNNRISGFGSDGIAGNTLRNSFVANNSISTPGNSVGHPIALRNIVPLVGWVHDLDNAFGTTVTGNKIDWPVTGGGAWAIIEDASHHAFASTDVNLVFGNKLTGNCGEFQKDNTSSSTGSVNDVAHQGSLTLSSVTALAAAFTAIVLQVEGTGGGSWAGKLYKHLTGAQQLAMIDDDTGNPVLLVGPGASGSASVSAGGVLSTGNRSTASVGDLLASGFAYLEGGLFFPTTPSYSMTAKQNALAGTTVLSAAGIRFSGGDFQKCISVSGGVPVWVPLATGGGGGVAPAYIVATVASSIATVDLSMGLTQEIDLTTATTAISNPIGITGQPVFTLRLVQDATGGRAVTFGSNYVGLTPAAFDTTPLGTTVIPLVVNGAGNIVRAGAITSF